MGDQLLPRKSRLAPGPLSNNRVGALAVAAAAGILLMSSQVPANAATGNTEGIHSASQNGSVLQIGSSLDGGRRFGPHGHHSLRDSHGPSDRGRGHKAGRNHHHAKSGKPGRANREGRRQGHGGNRPSPLNPPRPLDPPERPIRRNPLRRMSVRRMPVRGDPAHRNHARRGPVRRNPLLRSPRVPVPHRESTA